jgi:hypothetical protein
MVRNEVLKCNEMRVNALCLLFGKQYLQANVQDHLLTITHCPSTHAFEVLTNGQMGEPAAVDLVAGYQVLATSEDKVTVNIRGTKFIALGILESCRNHNS